MEQQIKVSVIIPIFNAQDFLRPAMDSILSQTLTEIEIICIDDGSTDGSLSLIKEYRENDDRIRIVTETNAGPARARNNGLRRARGEYVIFLDADDFFEPTLLAALYQKATEKNLDITVCDHDQYNEKTASFTHLPPAERGDLLTERTVTSKNELPAFIFQITDTSVWNKLFRRAFLQEKGLTFTEELRVFEDVSFTVCALSLAERIGKAKGILLHHRIYSAQTRGKLFRKYYALVPEVFLTIKKALMHHGMYLPLQDSFLNLVANRLYKVYNLLWLDTKVTFFGLLHETYAEKLGLSVLGQEDFYNEEVGEFIASVSTYTYPQYLKREAKGLKLKWSEILRIRKHKSKNFLTKLFSKKKKGQ